MSNPIENEKELGDLINKYINGFHGVVKQEQDRSNILLKGHLFIENLLEELLAVLDINHGQWVHKMSFSEKLKKLNEFTKKEKSYLTNKISNSLPSLFALNDVRNNLAHNFSFSISESDIDRIGNNLGSKYIINKYNKGHKELKENLLFCLEAVAKSIVIIIYHRICDLGKKQIESTQKSDTENK